MYKFYKTKDTETLRKVYDTESEQVIALIGQVEELVKLNIIFPDNTDGNMDKWLVIPKNSPDRIREYNTLDEAKAIYRNAE